MSQLPRWPIGRRTNLTPIGLDIGPSCVRAAQLERTDGGWRILRVSSWNRRGIEDSNVASAGFAGRIKRSILQSGYHGRHAVAGLSVPEVELHALEIPVQADSTGVDRIGQAVRWEMERVTSIPADEAASDYWQLPSTKVSNTTTIGAAGKSSAVEAATELARASGLECECVDSTACALSRLGVVAGYGGGDSPLVWGVLDVGQRLLRLVVSLGETPVLVRTLGGGSQAWTERIAESLELSNDAAETHKREHGIGVRETDGGTGASAEIAGMILASLLSELDYAVAEIERSYEYVMRCYPTQSLGALMLAGAGSDLAGLDDYLAKKLGVDVSGLNRIVETRQSRLAAAPSIRESLSGYACAIGLAIDREATA